ncbi:MULTISPECIES: PLP-dependent aminotransferase family protein [Yersinia]|jgi:2-aminoadipate transaminase|uniref:Aminotransferase n=1 Tax=Yersinia frederiksenii TaxID=29484 RepID=A0AAI8ZTU4_YERFR|nr:MULTISPECIES: PLP-dependent aminotransferase family protein [Yersinia]MDN0129498.1 PLP-dependent aminotransferase family protein [Yersinia massiliensis]CFR11097.1 aminotransferase [Yersinia frederiksenii]CNL72635.1 aminotransferase [Yersinia frederiksenii]
MISFAGGLPAVESFPHLNLDGMPQSMLQYGASEGESELRQQIAKNLSARGLTCSAEQVLIISGSQQGIDLVAKLFIDAGTPVAVESPTYLAALQVFRFFGARFVAYDSAQPDTEMLRTEKPAFAYTIPTFQNPSGDCLDAVQRAALAKSCDDLMLPLFEDDPYHDLVYDPCERKPVCALLQHAPWIYQGSFSKSLSPALRLGYLVASPELIPYLTRLKQAADLHSSRISQWLVLQQLRDPKHENQMSELANYYRTRRDAFEVSLQRHFAALAHWKKPAGGLFFWLTLNQRIDTRLLLPIALENNIAFMPGESFIPNASEGCGQLRLNFSHATEEQAELGLQKLAQLVQEFSSRSSV